MKKLLVFTLILGTMVFVVPSVEAKSAAAIINADPQMNVQIVQNRRNRRLRRIVTTTRVTRAGRYRYRETIRTTYLPNGRTRTQVISRVRIANRRGIRY
ncbi:MAG: hypothetical protein WKF92_13015 [Pyrinomonadaceae bacterium]